MPVQLIAATRATIYLLSNKDKLLFVTDQKTDIQTKNWKIVASSVKRPLSSTNSSDYHTSLQQEQLWDQLSRCILQGCQAWTKGCRLYYYVVKLWSTIHSTLFTDTEQSPETRSISFSCFCFVLFFSFFRRTNQTNLSYIHTTSTQIDGQTHNTQLTWSSTLQTYLHHSITLPRLI